ncbi:MAG: cysteine desulfurase, partial [Pseudomonadota bacterium]
RHGAVLKWIPVTEAGALDMDAYRAAFSPRTKFVAMTHMSNVLGTALPGGEIVDIAHAHGAKVMLDGCQAAAHTPIDVRDLDVDFYILTGHKLFGPTGIGALYGKADLLAEMRPYRGGGEMIDAVTEDAVTYNEPPHRFEAGTPPIVEGIGLGAAVEFIMGLDREAAEAHEKALLAQATDRLRELNWVQIYGEDEGKGAILSFSVEGAHPHDVSQLLDRSGVAVRAGHHCCQPLMARLGVSATARASFAAYNTGDDVERFIEGLVKAHSILG